MKGRQEEDGKKKSDKILAEEDEVEKVQQTMISTQCKIRLPGEEAFPKHAHLM